MRRLILWDIDGTLLRGTGHDLGLFFQALRDTYDLPVEIKRTDYGGKTDGQIVLETLALHEIDEDVALELLPKFSARYHALIESIAHELHRHLSLLPGVVELLTALRERDVIQTLLTGNMQPIALAKLRALGLEGFFDLDVGAYGSDDRDRTKLVPIARRKAEARHTGVVGDAIVIGDTPRDIACGKAGNARTVAVATGTWSVADLQAHTPDAVLLDLQNTSAAIAAILGE